MNNASHSLKAKIPASIGILVISLVIVGAIIVTRGDTTSVSKPEKGMSSMAMSPTQTSQTFKDGTYTKTGSYSSPAGTENVTVTLQLANSVVTGSMVMHGANDPTASSYQSLFISGYKGQVEGKRLSDIKLTNVSGSSLTPIGFMNALQQIENDAKV
jgi:hypothetical protein